MRILVLSCLSIAALPAARSQSSVGPQVLGMLLDQRPVRVVPAAGVFATKGLDPRSALTFDARWSYPYRIDFSDVSGGPRRLSVSSDTVLTSHAGYAMHNTMSLALGYQRAIAGNARRTRGWNWSIATGWSADRLHAEDDYVKLHTGEAGHVGSVRFDHFLVGRFGIGFHLRMHGGDLSCRITDDWRLPIGDATPGRRPISHHTAALSVAYGWRW